MPRLGIPGITPFLRLALGPLAEGEPLAPEAVHCYHFFRTWPSTVPLVQASVSVPRIRLNFPVLLTLCSFQAVPGMPLSAFFTRMPASCLPCVLGTSV